MYNDEDGFTHISKKKNKKTNLRSSEPIKRQQSISTSDESDELEQLTDQQLEKIVKFYETKATKFMQSNYFQKFNKLFTEIIDNLNFDQVICYGLGNFNKNTVSRKQLYFLICMRRNVKCKKWLIFDPVFSVDEESILKRLDFSLIEKNEYCRRSIKRETNDKIDRTIFYMPHCHKMMYNNLFWSNWNLKCLNNFYLIGNSFKWIMIDSVEPDDSKEYTYLQSLMKLNIVQEHSIENLYSNKQIFNDLSVHKFNTKHINENDLNRFFSSECPKYTKDLDEVYKE